jgi:hypothetical protein
LNLRLYALQVLQKSPRQHHWHAHGSFGVSEITEPGQGPGEMSLAVKQNEGERHRTLSA